MRKYSAFIKRWIAILSFMFTWILIAMVILNRLAQKKIVEASIIQMSSNEITKFAEKRIEECQIWDQWKCSREILKNNYWEKFYLDSCGKSSIHSSFPDLVAFGDCFTVSSIMFFIKTMDKKNLLDGVESLLDSKHTLVNVWFIDNWMHIITIITHSIETKDNYEKTEVNYYVKKREINKRTKKLITTGDIIKEKKLYIE